MNDTDYNKQLIIAAEKGDLETVKNCIAQGADVNFMGPNSAALHCAVFEQHHEIVRLLLESGANSNLVDNQGFVPIQLAASNDNAPICKLLFEHGADPLVKTSKGGTLLHLAAAVDFSYIFDLPEIKEIDIEARDYQGKTALNVAAISGSYLMIQELIKNNADINTADDDGITPLMSGLILLDSRKIKSWESIGHRQGMQVRYVISNGWMRYIKPYNGDEDELGRDLPTWEQEEIAELSWSPEGLQEFIDAIDVVALLLRNENIDKNHLDYEGNTAVMYACSVGEPKTLEQFYERKYPFDIPNNKGIHALHYLARNKRLDSLLYFFEAVKDADVNVVDENGWTAGHFLADQGGHPEMARLLIEKGLDLNLGSTKEFAVFPVGTKAFEVALHWNDEKMARLLNPN